LASRLLFGNSTFGAPSDYNSLLLLLLFVLISSWKSEDIHVKQRPFDFNHPDFLKHPPPRRELLKKFHKSGATEDQFVKAHQEILQPNGKVYNRSRLRQEYRRLQKINDFFSPTLIAGYAHVSLGLQEPTL
jgi:hypothetical protein